MDRDTTPRGYGRWQLCGDCIHFVPNEYDPTGMLGNCGLFMERTGSIGMTKDASDDACEDFE